MILLCNCSLSLNVCNIGLRRNLRFLSTRVLPGSVATRVNDGRIFNYFFIAHLLLSVTVKEFWRSVSIWQSYGKKTKWHLFFLDTVYKLPRCDSEMHKKSLNLCHVVSSCTVHVMFLSFYVRFYHCTACTVNFHCLHVRLLRVTLNINAERENMSMTSEWNGWHTNFELPTGRGHRCSMLMDILTFSKDQGSGGQHPRQM